MRSLITIVKNAAAAAAAKSLQSCLTLCDPMDCSLPGSSVHGVFQATVLEWGAIAFSTSLVTRAYIQLASHESLCQRNFVSLLFSATVLFFF